MGKNPSDVWEIPNVKARHVEKTAHPCQFPVAIPERLIRALTPQNGLVLDPFVGSGTTGVSAVLEGRRFVGIELQKEYYDIAFARISDALNGRARVREDKPVVKPNQNTAVARLPEEEVLHPKHRPGGPDLHRHHRPHQGHLQLRRLQRRSPGHLRGPVHRK